MPSQIPPVVLGRFTSFGDLLKVLRRRAGLTQRELSIAVGYSHAQISRLELGQRIPDLATIAARFLPELDLGKEPAVAERLLGLAAAPQEASQVPGLPPFKGLQFFDEADASLFFGREALTAKVVDRVHASLSAVPALRFMAVVGASGSGKSSFVRAGIIPAVRRSPSTGNWQTLTLTPTSRPLQALAVALSQNAASVIPTATLIDDLQRDPRALHLAAERVLNAAGAAPSPPAVRRARGASSIAPRQLLLLIDQFEELFTLCRDEGERRAFINNLMAAAVEPGGTVFVVIALRADFYPHCGPYADLREPLASLQTYLGPMSTDELRRAIEEPAGRGRWELEPGLVEVLLHDVGSERGQSAEPGALPLLSHALLQTWHRRRGRTLTVSGYLASGGVRGAIAETADDIFRDQLDPEQQVIARNIFLRLTQLGEDDATGETRRRATFEELMHTPEDAPGVRAVLTILADTRLITIDNGVAEVAHEALIREWPTLRGWLEEDREGLRLHRHLTLAAEGWERRGRDPGECYRGARLAQTLDWAATHLGVLSGPEQAFIGASRRLAEGEEAERDAQRRRELEAAQALAETQRHAAAQLRRRALYLTGAFILSLIMAGVALFQGEQARRSAVTAQDERRTAFERELAAAATSNLTVDPERSVLLALQAVRLTREADGTVLPEIEEALHRSILTSQVRLTLTGHETRVVSAAFSSDGTRLATIGDDGTAIIWNATTGRELLRLEGNTTPSDFVSSQRLAFSPDGMRLASADNNLIVIWDAASGEKLTSLAGHPQDVTAVVFSPDGELIASGGLDSSVRVWDARTGALRLVLSGHTEAIEGLAFSPEGNRLASAGDDYSLKIWDVETGELWSDRSDFTDLVESVAFSPDGSYLAASTPDGLKIWEASTPSGAEVLTIEETVGAVTFSPDGTRLAAASGSAAKLWDARTGRELLALPGHTSWVIDVAFSPDGTLLATASLDGTAKVWNLTTGYEVAAFTRGGWRVAYSPDGTRLATNGFEGVAGLWDAATGKQLGVLSGHAADVLGVAFSPDGQRLATASADQTGRVWDTATGRHLLTLVGHEDGVRDIAYSPDGTLIATASFDGSARVWDAASGQSLLTLVGHTGIVVGVAFSPDGQRIATSSTDSTAMVWDARTGQILLTLVGHTHPIPDIAFSPDGARIATGCQDTTAKIWDAANGAELLTLAGHSAEIQSVAFSTDGMLIATGSGDNTAKVWDAQTGEELLALPGTLGGVGGVAFNPLPGSQQLAVASANGVVRVFLLRLQDLVQLAESRVTRSLTQEECRKYMHLEQCPASDT